MEEVQVCVSPSTSLTTAPVVVVGVGVVLQAQPDHVQCGSLLVSGKICTESSFALHGVDLCFTKNGRSGASPIPGFVLTRILV